MAPHTPLKEHACQFESEATARIVFGTATDRTAQRVLVPKQWDIAFN